MRKQQWMAINYDNCKFEKSGKIRLSTMRECYDNDDW